MMRPQPRSTRTDPSFPTRRSSDLNQSVGRQPGKGWLPLDGCPLSGAHRDPAFYYYGRESIRPANFSDLSESGLAAGSEQWTGAIATLMKKIRICFLLLLPSSKKRRVGKECISTCIVRCWPE